MPALIPKDFVEQLVCISTAHVSKATADKMPQCRADLDDVNQPDWWPEFLRDEGWLFFLYSSQDEFEFKYKTAPKDLNDVLQYMHNSGFRWCMFDCDGAIIDGLHQYEW